MSINSHPTVAYKFKDIVHGDTFGVIAIIFAFFLLVIAFAIVPLPGGDDWETFYGAASRVLKGVPLYGTKITFSYFYNPPWLALLFAPLGILPFRWGWSIISVASMFNVFLICGKWKLGAIKLVAIILSPPILYTLLHGNIDALIIGIVLLPEEFWAIAALTKPQAAIALSIEALRSNWLKTIMITGGVILLSFVIFGNWLPAYLAQPVEMMNAGHNVFRGLWPYQIIVGLLLAYLGWRKKDEEFLVGASPFFSPYAATSSLLGPLMLIASKIKDWQVVVLVTLYWLGAILITYL